MTTEKPLVLLKEEKKTKLNVLFFIWKIYLWRIIFFFFFILEKIKNEKTKEKQLHACNKKQKIQIESLLFVEHTSCQS